MLVHLLYRGTVTHKLEGDLTLDAMAVSVSSKLPNSTHSTGTPSYRYWVLPVELLLPPWPLEPHERVVSK